MIGWRIIKTGIAVGICIRIAQLLKFEYPFYSAIAAVIAMQATIEDSLKAGFHRMQGTIVGAFVGFLFALVAVNNPLWTGLGLIVTLSVLKWMQWQEAMNIASIVFIAVSINLTGKPLDYAFNRIIDTAVGIIVAYFVNRFVVPPRYDNETEKSFQRARHQVISLYQTAFRALLDPKVQFQMASLDQLKNSLTEARAFVSLVQKDSTSTRGKANFNERFLGPLTRLEQMHFMIEQLLTLREVWHSPISPKLQADLVHALNRSYALLSLITKPNEHVASNAYDDTCEILQKIRIKVIKDHEGTYVGQNREYILELLDWIEQLTEATCGCLKITT